MGAKKWPRAGALIEAAKRLEEMRLASVIDARFCRGRERASAEAQAELDTQCFGGRRVAPRRDAVRTKECTQQ